MIIRQLISAYSYSIYQWLFFFFLYSLIGWVWETLYVSIMEKKFENRGFMKGPFLPIYGAGAITILLFTLPVRHKPVLVFILGMMGATLLELITGIIMEKMFKVKYWDYANEKINYKGHISLRSSILWGVVALGMMYGFHKPIEDAVIKIPTKIINPIVMVVFVVIAADFATSFKAALDLRDFLIQFEKIKDELLKLQKKAALFENKAVTALLKRNPGAISKEYAQALVQYKDLFIQTIKSKIDDTIEKITEDKSITETDEKSE
ncbi:MAG: putative ABC transporter permease [Lachnospiraceae bacterium]|nr:putative ABC transporter permease [Lachnospiraceae bacterium]